MSDAESRIGIDFRDNLFYVARIDHHAARQEIKALLRLEREHLGEHHLLNGGRGILSVPDEMVMVKRVNLNGSDDIDQRVKFEFIQSLPEESSQYLFDVKESGLDGRYLGMAIRRDRLQEYKIKALGDKVELFDEAGHTMRAAALAAGYTEFCRKSGGDLICLADFIGSAASLAFVYQNALIDLCHFPLSKFDPGTSDGFRKMAVELKTLINFRTASLFSDGVTTPLSNLLVSGEGVDDRFLERLREFFSIDVTRPSINPGFFSGQTDLTNVPLEKYLVALGLAAN